MADADAGFRHISVQELAAHEGQEVILKGWLYSKRGSKHLLFLMLRDGTGLVQCVVAADSVDVDTWRIADEATQESALVVTGKVIADERQTGGVELVVSSLKLVGESEGYPITPKEHGVDFLMSHRHLWLRSRLPWAILRIRNRLIVAIHTFFQERGFLQMDAPILTGNAVEGTSSLFELDYFDEKAYLTQSGQLYGEAMAMAFGRIYTFGPTFRAEKSKTRRHLTEFWMIEPEMAFFDLDTTLDLAEDLLVYTIEEVLEHCSEELTMLERDPARLECVRKPFPRISYTQAVALLRSDETADMLAARIQALEEENAALSEELAVNRNRYGQSKKSERRRLDAREIAIHRRTGEIAEALQNLPVWKASARSFEWGSDFGGSDETVLTWHFDRPVMVHRYPAAVKAFYMKRDPDDARLAMALDVLAPEGYGEVIGGGERATDLAFLEEQIAAHQLPKEAFEWYLDLRRFGSVPHAGFGLGLERMLTWIAGIDHVRETIPFPRLMGRIAP